MSSLQKLTRVLYLIERLLEVTIPTAGRIYWLLNMLCKNPIRQTRVLIINFISIDKEIRVSEITTEIITQRVTHPKIQV